MEDRFIIFEIKSRGPRPGDFGFSPSADEPPEVEIHLETLGPTEEEDARRNPAQRVARDLPTTLIEPVAMDDTVRPAEAEASWGVEAVGATDSPFSGSGIKVAVLDTGIDAGHDAFRELTVTQRDFTGEGEKDVNGHGTHCAGTIVGRDVDGFRIGVARGVTELLAGKVLGSKGGSTGAVVQGVQWAVESEANVISMSLGIDFPGAVKRLVDQGLEVQPATSRALEGYRDNLRMFDAVVDYVKANAPFGRSALIIAATGNESARAAPNPYTIGASPPAVSEGFIGVGALGRNDGGLLVIADFSNAGASVVGPGVDILSAKVGGGFAKASGTSMATPHVAGVAALWGEKIVSAFGSLDRNELANRLMGNSEPVAGLTPSDVGSGLVKAPVR